MHTMAQEADFDMVYTFDEAITVTIQQQPTM